MFVLWEHMIYIPSVFAICYSLRIAGNIDRLHIYQHDVDKIYRSWLMEDSYWYPLSDKTRRVRYGGTIYSRAAFAAPAVITARCLPLPLRPAGFCRYCLWRRPLFWRSRVCSPVHMSRLAFPNTHTFCFTSCLPRQYHTAPRLLLCCYCIWYKPASLPPATYPWVEKECLQPQFLFYAL